MSSPRFSSSAVPTSRSRRLRTLLLACMALVVAPAAAHGEVVDDNPAALAADGVQYVAENIAGEIAIKSRVGDGVWTGWRSLGGFDGPLTSGPSLSSRPGIIDVFARTPDQEIAHRAYVKGKWGPWESIGGCSKSAPSSMTLHQTGGAVKAIEVFYVGCDDRIKHLTWLDAAGWSEEAAFVANQEPDFEAQFAPAAIETATPGYFYVFAVGRANGRLYWMSQFDGPWGWIEVSDAVVTDAPSAVHTEASPVVFARHAAEPGASAGNLMQIRWETGANWWTIAESAGSAGESGPAVLERSPGVVSVFSRDASQTFMKTASVASPADGVWETWTQEVGPWVDQPQDEIVPDPRPPAVVVPVDTTAPCPNGIVYRTSSGTRCATSPVPAFWASAVARSNRIVGMLVSPTVKGQVVRVSCVSKCAKRARVVRVRAGDRSTTVPLRRSGIRHGSVVEVRLQQRGATARFVRYRVVGYPYLARQTTGCLVGTLSANCEPA